MRLIGTKVAGFLPAVPAVLLQDDVEDRHTLCAARRNAVDPLDGHSAG
jgi:hypothetical protein